MSKENKQHFRIIDEQVMANCFAEIVKRHQDGELINVIITNKDETRSLAQNRLYWLWLHFIANKKGEFAEYYHVFFKREFLASIYAKNDGEYAELFYRIKECEQYLSTARYENMAKTVATLLSTKKANTKEFSEYLNRIEMWAYKQGLPPLPCPPDLKWVRG